MSINNHIAMGLLSAYTQAIINAGGIPLMVPLGLGSDAWPQIFETADGIMLPGGGDIDPALYDKPIETELRGVDRERDEFEIWLVNESIAQKKPLLAICRGHQVLNTALGGTLWQDVTSQRPSQIIHDTRGRPSRSHLAHIAIIEPNSQLGRCLGEREVGVNSIHHQAIQRLGKGLRVTAVSPDNSIEAIELADHPFAIGVQWHPEWLVQDSVVHRRLFASFVEAAAMK